VSGHGEVLAAPVEVKGVASQNGLSFTAQCGRPEGASWPMNWM
jgi:hypothetical protein